MNKFMENCYKKVEGFLDSCGKFFGSAEDAWVSDAAKELQTDHNNYVRNCNLGRFSAPNTEMSFDQATRVIRKALEFARNKHC